jgi:hypothetical protein
MINPRAFTLPLILCAIFSFGFNSIERPYSESLEQSTGDVFFSKTLLIRMMNRIGCDAIRFYSAKESNKGPESILAVCVSQESDMQVNNDDTKYLLFTGIQDGAPKVKSLSKNKAAAAVQRVKSKKIAVTIDKSDIQSIIQVEDCTGLRLTRDTTSDGSPTYLLISAKLSGNYISETQRPQSHIGKNPCPPSCGTSISQQYLSTLSR